MPWTLCLILLATNVWLAFVAFGRPKGLASDLPAENASPAVAGANGAPRLAAA